MWVILYINPEEVATIVRTKEHTVLFNLLDKTVWVVVHQVSESVLRFVTLRGNKCVWWGDWFGVKCKVKHDRNCVDLISIGGTMPPCGCYCATTDSVTTCMYPPPDL